LLLALGACIEPASAPPEPVPVALLTPEVWSGGEAVLASAAFTPDRGLPVVLVNDDTLVMRRLDDTTVAVRMPDLPGTQSLHVLAADVLDLPIAIELRGFESWGEGPLLSGRLQVLPGWPPSVVGSGASSAVVWNLQSAATTPLPDSLHDPTCSRGVGPSYAPGSVALIPTCLPDTRWWSWSLRPQVELTEDSLCGAGHFVAELAPGRVVSVGAHDVAISLPDSATCTRSFLAGAEGTYDVVSSPRGDRAVIIAFGYPTGYGGTGGVPVLDVATGQVAYEITQVRANPSAAFSADGDTLFVTGDDAAPETVLLAVRATDGQPLQSRSLALQAWAVAPDPERPWLYVTGHAGGHGQLLVLDRASLALLATVGTPDTVNGFQCCDVVAHIVPSPAEQRVYVISTLEWWGPTYHAYITRFRTPP
jgi:hypothetical protein